jgi:CO/xanthine dehydrogenase FAD-binding subunit
VKAAPFRYERPSGLEQALELLRDSEHKALAGGQSLVPMMAMRLARPQLLVDLGSIRGLDSVSERDGQLVTGEMVRQRSLERRPGLPSELPLVAAALPHVGHREVRNRGTVGGSIAHADPAGELGLVAATLRATVVARGPGGSREIAADQFAQGPFQTALATARPGDAFAFAEVARRHGDFALCGAAVHVRREERRIVLARVGLLGIGPTPIVHELTDALAGSDTGEAVADVAAGLSERVDPGSDMHASASYRRRLVRVLVQRCLARALDGSPA